MKFNVRINIRRQAATTPQKLHLICRWNGNTFVYPLPFNVSPKHWNNKAQSVRNVIDEPNKDSINAYLNDIKKEVVQIYSNEKAKRNPITKELLKNGLDLWNGFNVIENRVIIKQLSF